MVHIVMRYERSKLDTEDKGKSLLGRFNSELLSFRIYRSQVSIYCEEETRHFRVPLILPPHLSSEGSPEHWQTFLSSCFGQFLERSGLQVFPKLCGGGCSFSTPGSTLPSRRTSVLRTDPEEERYRRSFKQIASSTVKADSPNPPQTGDPNLTTEGVFTDRKLPLLLNVQAVPDFVGREVELEQGKEILNSFKKLTIAGPPGSGKTALATTLALTFVSDLEIVWKCRADTETNLSGSLTQLAYRLKLGRDFSTLLNYLNSHPVLLILDNLDSALPERFQELVERNIRVIITSRNRRMRDNLEINGLEQDVGVEFVIGLTKRESERQEIEGLCWELYALPLALKIAIGILNTDPSETVSRISKLIRECPEDSEDENPSPRLKRLLEECVNLVPSEAAKHLLLLTLDLSPSVIPEQLYKEMFFGEARELDQALTEVEGLSLIEEDEEHNLSVHPFAQDAVRICYSDEVQGLFPVKVMALLNLFDWTVRSELSVDLSQSIGTIINFIEHKTVLEETEVSLCIRYVYFCMEQLGCVKATTELCQKCCEWKNNPTAVTEDSASDLNTLAVCCLNIGYFLEAETYMSQVIDFRKSSNNKRLLADSYVSLACACKEQGKLAEAEQYHLSALKLREEILPPVRSDLAASYTYLAAVYKDQGNLDTAEQYYLKAVKVKEAVLPYKHPEFAKSYSDMSVYKEKGKDEEEKQFRLKSVSPRTHSDLTGLYSSLATVYHQHGKLGVAEQFHLKALKIKESVLPPLHLDLALAYITLASLYKEIGNLEESEKFHLKALNIYETVLPNTDVSLITSYSSLADVYKDQGQLEKTEEFQLKALKIRQAVLDPMHPDLASSYNSLACAYKSQGKLEKAEIFHMKALKIREAVLTSTDPNLAVSFSNLATVYQKQGKLEKAEHFHLKALKIRKSVLPPTHLHIGKTYYNLGCTYQKLGKHDKAESSHLKALTIREAGLPPTHHDLVSSYNNLACACQKLGKLIEAEGYHLKALKIREAVLSPTDTELAGTYSNLACVYKEQGKLQDAEQFHLKALAIREAVLPPNHSDLVASYTNLAGVYQKQGKLVETEDFLLKVLKIREETLPPAHPDLVKSYSNLAHLYHFQGKLEEAEKYYSKSLKVYETNLPPTHPDLTGLCKNLATVHNAQRRSSRAETTPR